MRLTRAFFLFLLTTVAIIELSFSSALATTYYVSTSGNDFYSGGATNPWQTIDHALTAVSNGDTVVIGAGEFDEWLLITNSVTLCGADIYQSANPVFSRHETRTIIRPPYTNRRDSPVVSIMAPNVSIKSITIDGDADDNGQPDSKYGIYSTGRPINVEYCRIGGIGGYGIGCVGTTPSPAPSDDDSFRSRFACNLITNITHTNASEASGILLQHVAASVVSNEFLDISGTNAKAGVFIESCYYTSNMTEPLTVSDNYFDGCATAIDANKFGTKGEKMLITDNIVTNAIVGIRLIASRGQALATRNRITAGGISFSSNAAPARGIWVRADFEPWDADQLAVTDHFISENILRGVATNSDGSVGLCFDYDSDAWLYDNNGARATVMTNLVYGFDTGARLKSGANGVSKPHDPLVEVVFFYNDIAGNISYGVNSEDSTNLVNAVSNWWGSVNGPITPFANPVSSNVLYNPWLGQAFMIDTDNDGILDYIDPDDDNDGLPDWEEIIAGTDPLNRLSVLEFTDVRWSSAKRVTLTWSTVSNKTYFLYSATNLLTGPWVAMTNTIATPPTDSYVDTNAIFRSLFYKVTVSN